MTSVLDEILALYQDILTAMKAQVPCEDIMDKMTLRNDLVTQLFSPTHGNEQQRKAWLDVLLPLQREEETYLVAYRQSLEKMGDTLTNMQKLKAYS